MHGYEVAIYRYSLLYCGDVVWKKCPLSLNNYASINALASASDLKTTPPTDKEPPLADRKKRGKSDACQCVIYNNLHLMLMMLMATTTVHYFA